jgi:hypothetical protein
MSQQCPHCGFTVQDGGTFCGECGGVLVLRLPAGRAARAGPAPRSRLSVTQDTGPLDRQFPHPGGQGNDIDLTLRCHSARAAIAALHDCTLEGGDAALRTTGAEPSPAPAAAMTGVPG